MQERKLSQIKEIALGLHEATLPWHFHILAPGCVLNEGANFVFILEDTNASKVYSYHSSQAEKGLGQELLPLLHGKKILDHSSQKAAHHPNETVKDMVERAKALNQLRTPWHHHVIFPQCTFNEQPGKWVLMLEAAGKQSILKNQTTHEPVDDLALIEPLFYAQSLTVKEAQ